MGKNHIKSLNAPPTWEFCRKENTFITRPNSGAHTLDHTFSISFLLKHVLNIANTLKEVKHILHEGNLFVDGKKVHDEKAQVGLMDVVSFPKTKQHFRVLLTQKNKLCAVKIDEKEAGFKIVKIKSKTTNPKNKTQLNCTSGRNILVEKDTYKTGESIVLQLPSQKISESLPFKEGSIVLLTNGNKAGTVGKLKKIEGNTIQVQADTEFETQKIHAFVIGKEKSIIKTE